MYGGGFFFVKRLLKLTMWLRAVSYIYACICENVTHSFKETQKHLYLYAYIQDACAPYVAYTYANIDYIKLKKNIIYDETSEYVVVVVASTDMCKIC